MNVRVVSLVAALSIVAPTEARAQNCAATSVGVTPLNDLGAGSYMSAQGGLYPGGANVRPPAHEAAGVAAAALVVPRDAAGAPDPAGRIGFISIGMSNTRNHFNQFVPLANADPDKAAYVDVVNAAQGGQPAEDIDEATDPYWTFVDDAVASAGLTAAQVQAVWLLQANRAPSLPFPDHALVLRDQLVAIVRILRDRFPNLRQVFLASRIYAGYATTLLNPEPYAYEGAFAKKWLIEQQLSGDPALNFDAANGPVEAPWLSWSTYTWADGLVPRSDGLIWECSDFNADGTHPNPQGSTKVANMLLAFMHADTATTWWFGDGGEPPAPTDFCFGDGGDPLGCTDCPCGNDAPPGAGTGCLNGSGTGATLDFGGVASVSQDSLFAGFSGANPDTFAVLVSGGTQMPQQGPCPPGSGISTPFFDGLRCIGGGAVRHGSRATGPQGMRTAAWNPSQNGGIAAFGGYTAGETRHFMLIYRELAALVCHTGQNTSHGVTIEFGL